MTLQDCTKAELLSVIDKLRRHLFTNGDYYVRMALLEVERQREEVKYAKAEELSDLAYKKRLEYYDLLRSYEGKKLCDVPRSVLKLAENVLKEAQNYDRAWNEIMGYDQKHDEANMIRGEDKR